MKIHHATAKKAKTHKIDLTVEDNEVVASKNGVRLASGLSGTLVLEVAIGKLAEAGDVKASKSPMGRALRKMRDKDEEFDENAEEFGGEGDEPSEDEEPEIGKSIIKKKYKDKYKPTKMTCGDDLAQQLKEYLTYDDGGVDRIDEVLLKKFAKANECWVESYASLANVGQRRMNIGNKLRAKLRHDPDYAVVWP